MRLTPELVREYFGSQGAPSTKSLAVLDAVTPKVRAIHDKSYPGAPTGTPLLALNSSKYLGVTPFTGFLLTGEAFAFRTLKDRFLSSVLPSVGRNVVLPLAEVKSFQIGAHDRCLGNQYIGHQLIINGEVQGLVRMGRSVIYDSKAIEAVNGFAQFLFDRGVVDAAPKAYAAQ